MMDVHALNVMARVALFFLRPKDAQRLVGRVADAWPRRLGEDEARRAVQRLKPLGTCLSRSLAIAAMLPNAEVIIGIRKEVAGEVRAHAWVEWAGRPLDAEEAVGEELARLGRAAPGSSW
jgi:hypothetical protein